MAQKPKKTDRRGAPKGSHGNVAHEVSAERQQLVKTHAAVGTPHETIAHLMGISADTLTKYYRAELDHGLHEANAMVGGQLFNLATGKRQNPTNPQAAMETVDPMVQLRAAQFWQDRRGGPGWKARQQHDLGFSMGSGEVDAQPDQNAVAPAKITIEFVQTPPVPGYDD